MVQSSIRKETPAKLICYISFLVNVSLLEKETTKISSQWKFQSIRDVKFISANLKKSPIRKNFILYGIVFNMQRNMLTNWNEAFSCLSSVLGLLHVFLSYLHFRRPTTGSWEEWTRLAGSRLASKARPCFSLSFNLTLLRSHVQVKTFSRSVFFMWTVTHKRFEYVLHLTLNKNKLWNIQHKIWGPKVLNSISQNLKTFSISNFKKSVKANLSKNISHLCSY